MESVRNESKQFDSFLVSMWRKTAFHIPREIFMMSHTTAALNRRHVSTDEFADRVLVLPETILKCHSRTGQYAGIRPVRLPNRRLAWPVDEIERLFETHNLTTSVKEADSHDAANNQRDKTTRLSIDEINALNRHIADTWTPEMDEEIERMSRQEAPRKRRIGTAA
jgi:hypothetical protein